MCFCRSILSIEFILTNSHEREKARWSKQRLVRLFCLQFFSLGLQCYRIMQIIILVAELTNVTGVACNSTLRPRCSRHVRKLPFLDPKLAAYNCEKCCYRRGQCSVNFSRFTYRNGSGFPSAVIIWKVCLILGENPSRFCKSRPARKVVSPFFLHKLNTRSKARHLLHLENATTHIILEFRCCEMQRKPYLYTTYAWWALRLKSLWQVFQITAAPRKGSLPILMHSGNIRKTRHGLPVILRRTLLDAKKPQNSSNLGFWRM